MKNIKKLRKGVIYTLILLILLITILGNLRLNVFNLNFYEKEFVKNNVEIENKENISEKLIYFLRDRESGNEFINDFNEEEQTHLYEVREVISWFLIIFYFSLIIGTFLIIFLFYLDKNEFKKNLGKCLFYSGIVIVGVIILLFLLSLNFDLFFDIFHSLFFNTQWRFPRGTLLVSLFPESFFIDFFKKILFNSVVIGMIFGLIGHFLRKLCYPETISLR